MALLGLSAQSVSLMAKGDKDEESYNYQRAVEAFQIDDLPQAYEWTNRELSGNPKNGFAYMLLSTIYSQSQDYGSALETAEKALKYLPKKAKEEIAYVHSIKAETHLALKDTLTALNDYDLAIKTYPTDEDYYVAKAQVLAEMGEYDKSDAEYERLGKQKIGEMYRLCGLGANAKSRGQLDKALDYFNQAIEKYPDYGTAYAFRSEVYMNQERWTESVNDIVSAYNNEAAEWVIPYVTHYDKRGLPVLASRMKFQMAQEPGQYVWPALIAMAYDNNGMYRQAIEWYDKVLEGEPYAAVYKALAECYNNIHDEYKALENINKALELTPEVPSFLGTKCDILTNLGDYDGAVAVADEYIKLAPDDAYAYMLRSRANSYLGKYHEAVEDLEAVTFIADSQDDLDPIVFGMLADVLRLDGQTDRADSYCRMIVDKEKGQPLTVYSVTPFAYASLGMKQEALDVLQSILDIEVQPGEDNYLYHAACVYARLGDKAKALEYLEKALESGYHNEKHILNDYDMLPILDTPEFRELMDKHFPDTKARDDSPAEVKPVIDVVAVEAPVRSKTSEVPFKRENGVTKVECTVNGLPLHFVFDTGASDVTMSMVEANFMLKNGYLKRSDIKGSSRYQDANGNVSEGTVLNLRHINFGGLELENVRASVVRNQQAPLLLGQSVLSRLGKIEIDNPGAKLIITKLK